MNTYEVNRRKIHRPMEQQDAVANLMAVAEGSQSPDTLAEYEPTLQAMGDNGLFTEVEELAWHGLLGDYGDQLPELRPTAPTASSMWCAGK